MEELINFWRQLNLKRRPFIHKEDRDNLLNVGREDLTFQRYISNAENLFISNTKIHSGLIPVPYTGNLKSAQIFLLMINPGFHHNDYYSETINDFKQALINNLRQENIDDNYPFVYLNPKFCHTSGGEYWLRKFDNIIEKLKVTLPRSTYEEILKLISRNICSLELFPYHSKNFKIGKKTLGNLESVKRIKGFLKIKIENNKHGVILSCLRRPKDWDIPSTAGKELKDQNSIDLPHRSSRVYILPSTKRQSASLKTDGELGGMIFNRLKEIFQE